MSEESSSTSTDEGRAETAENSTNNTADAQSRAAYWKANIKLLAQLLTVWFVVSFGFGILLADWLNQFSVFGFKLGFWFAQQGSIYVFVVLIFIYARKMRKLDHEFGVQD